MEKRNLASMKNMSFIERSCGSDEKLILGAHIHWIYLLIGASWMLGFFALGYGIHALAEKTAMASLSGATSQLSYLIYKIGQYSQMVCAAIGVIIFGCYYVTYDTTRVGLTTKRLILRKGLIKVKLIEVDLEEIKSESVDHGLLGRFLDYGKLVLDARFVANFDLPSIANPYRLLRAMHEVRSAIGDSVNIGAVQHPAAPAAPPVQDIYAPSGPTAPAAPSAFIPDANSRGPVAPLTQIEIVDETDDYVVYKKNKTLPV